MCLYISETRQEMIEDLLQREYPDRNQYQGSDAPGEIKLMILNKMKIKKKKKKKRRVAIIQII